MKKVIATKAAPAAIGPYSQAIEVGNMLFASGQIPINPATSEIPFSNYLCIVNGRFRIPEPGETENRERSWSTEFWAERACA